MRIKNGLVLDLNQSGPGQLLVVRKNLFTFTFEATEEAIEALGRDRIIEAATVQFYNELQSKFTHVGYPPFKQRDNTPIDKKELKPTYVEYHLQFPEGTSVSLLSDKMVSSFIPGKNNTYYVTVEENLEELDLQIQRGVCNPQRMILKLQNLFPDKEYLIDEKTII